LFALRDALIALEAERERIERWGRRIAGSLVDGRRLLAAGNGGSAAEAQHLTAELVGRYCDERRPLSAIALHADSSSVTAIANDYSFDEVFARQVRAHGRPGDVLVAFSTSGRSLNVCNAARAARDHGLSVLAVTGTAPNPLADLADDVIAITAPSPTVQEAHLVVVHLLCEEVDAYILGARRLARART
jgi:D-sedoheptulose 7-phosphate isomerase